MGAPTVPAAPLYCQFCGPAVPQEPPPLAAPKATDKPPLDRPPDLGSSPHSLEPTFPCARRPPPGVSPGPRLLLPKRAPGSSAASGPGLGAEPASASLSLATVDSQHYSFFFKGLFFFLRCVRAVAWRQRSYSAASPFSQDPPPASHSSLSAPGSGARGAPGPKALLAARSRPGPQPEQRRGEANRTRWPKP